ncbi:MAG TPA: PfkB family carbohydrate kinase [Longimicrobiales bacterium]|nr:PfkB family carbohydrate kinase [Longimicrobiales bacterium]
MRLGILGTMVWDRIHARDGRAEPVEEWGGISYALAAAVAAAPPDTTVVPLIRLGSDLAEHAFTFLRTLGSPPRLDLDHGIRVVPDPNNRVELRYHDRERRCERLTGGVGPWHWTELAPLLDGLDALYVNFISGFEMELPTAVALRAHFHGPIYTDLHSLMLGITPTGARVPRPLAAWREWLRCFDAVQVNEDELGLLAHAWGDPWLFAAEVVGEEPRLLLVTLGERGAAYVAAPELDEDPRMWQRARVLVPGAGGHGAVRTQRVGPELRPRDGDPTGCGDVWGASFFCTLLGGHGLGLAMQRANAAAARNVEHLGATGLHHHLQGRIGT